MTNEQILEKLKKFPVRNAWVIQDLTVWPEQSKIFFKENKKGFSYLHISGHPSQRRNPLVILENAGGEVESLLSNMPQGPSTIREISADLTPVIQKNFPNAKIYLEQRMTVTRETFKPRLSNNVRQLTVDDAQVLAVFSNSPPQALPMMKMWIHGAIIMALFENEKIVSLGTTIVKTPDVWHLAGIETKPEYRGRGYASLVTSALTAACLEKAPTVSLTVLKDNPPALKVYSNLGYAHFDDVLWVDNGSNSKP